MKKVNRHRSSKEVLFSASLVMLLNLISLMVSDEAQLFFSPNISATFNIKDLLQRIKYTERLSKINKIFFIYFDDFFMRLNSFMTEGGRRIARIHFFEAHN